MKSSRIKKKRTNIKETKNNIKMSWRFMKKRKKSLFLMLFLSLILSLISVVIPVLSAKQLLSLSSGLLKDLIRVSIFIFIVEITRNITSFLMNKASDIYMLKTVTDVQMEMFSETLKIETLEIDKSTSGTFIDRINNDTNDIIGYFSRIITDFIDFISNIGILVAILFISKYMFIYFIITTIIIGYINKKRRDMYHKRAKKFRKIREKRTGLISEIIRGVRDVKLLNAKEGILAKTKKQLEEVNVERIKMSKTSNRFNFFSGSIRDLFDVSFILLGTVLISINDLSIANFIVLYTYKNKIETLLNVYNSIAQQIKDFNLSATRVFEVLDNKYQKEKDTGKELTNIMGQIEFKNVSFSYDKDNVLENINFKINPGERVGFVGESGSGKSTIFNLITRLYMLNEGTILIDNQNINDISISSLRKNISLISQNPYIFNFSIEENLKIANPKIDNQEMIEACKKSYIYEKIMDFDKGFKEEIGEGGIVLSGGEKQRLAIARSLLKKSNIILFDEATSALDNITQDKVQSAIYKLDKEKTILIIAHRLSTVINCDKLIVLDKGHIVGMGKHEELLKTCPKYKQLFKYETINNN